MSDISSGTGVAEEVRSEEHGDTPAGQPGTLAVSANEFAALEERVLRAVNLVKRERLAHAAAEERANAAEERAHAAEARIEEQNSQIDTLQKEMNALRGEREAVRQRVEKVLSQLDELEV